MDSVKVLFKEWLCEPWEDRLARQAAGEVNQLHNS